VIQYFLITSLLLAATTNPAPEQPAPPKISSSAPVVREVAPGILEYNGVRLDKKNHRISFPVTVNQRVGLIEYLLVNDKGKTHESLFATALQPHDIHLAMLLIGLKEDAKANPKEPVPPSAIDSAYLQSAPKLKGAPVTLSVTWTQDGKQKQAGVEDWVLNVQTNRPMTPGPWTYNGSLIENGVFLADGELSIIAVVTDPTALVNNPRKGYDNDEIWQAREEAVPPLDTPVELTITLIESSGTGKP
jgi:hypothetical protein